MSYFDFRPNKKDEPQIKMPEVKMETMDWQVPDLNDDLERIMKEMANATGWNSYWTQNTDIFSEYVPEGSPQNPVSSEEIRNNLPDEYKNLSLEELSEKLLEDEGGQEALKKAIEDAKIHNVKEKKSDSYEELMRLVKEYQDQQQYPQWQAKIHKPDPPKYYYNYYDDRID